MPSTYSHYYFGQLVYAKLSEEKQQLISKHRDLYDIGQNGPDILLYHAPLKGSHIARQNHKIHMNSGKDFFEKALDKHQNNPQHLTYLYGYVCHFVLDVYCHPYIEEYKRKNNISHMAIEREFERYLLEKNGLNPLRYSLTTHIHPTKELEKVMACYVEGASQKDMRQTLKIMKCMYAFTKASNDVKRKIIYIWMDKIGKPYLKDFVFTKYPNSICDKCNEELNCLLNKAVIKAVELIEHDFSLEDELYNEIFG